MWDWLSLQGIAQDLRYAARTLSKAPVFTAVAVVSLALGIAANTTVFSLIDAIWFRALQARDPQQLVRIYVWGLPKGAKRAGIDGFSWPLYDAVRKRSTILQDVVAHYSTAPLQVSTGGETNELQGAVVSANYFPALGIQPALGRFFLPEEDQVRGRDAVAVISAGYWQRQFGGDASVLGRSMEINGVVFRVIGVAPKDFRGIGAEAQPNDIWIPTMMLETGYRWCNGFEVECATLDVIGRLPRGRKIEEARAELSAIIASVDTVKGYAGPRSAFLEKAVGLELSRAVYADQIRLMSGIAALLLILACANIAGLLLARGMARRKEIAIRLALGAPRLRLIRQLLTESMLLGAGGTALGLLLTFWTRSLLASFYATNTEGYAHFYDLHMDVMTLSFSMALAIVAVSLFGLVPALQGTRIEVGPPLKGNDPSPSGSGRGMRFGLVSLQFALSILMVVSANLLARSARHIEEGGHFNPHGIAVLRLRPRIMQYTPARSQAFLRQVVSRLETLPGVESVTFARGNGLVWQDCCLAFLPDYEPQATRVDYHVIAPHYFSTLRIAMLAGRDFNEHDQVGSSPVAIVNESMARTIDPSGGNVVGRTFLADGKPLQVVGIVKDWFLRSTTDAPLPVFYKPFWQSAEEVDARMAIRVQSDPGKMLPVLRQAIAEVDPRVPVTEQSTMLDQVESNFMQARLAAAVLEYASGLALLLSAIGLYGLIAYKVTQQTREIGIRMALGARPANVHALILRKSLAVVAPGIGLGLAAAVVSTRLLGSWLYGVRATDPSAFITGGIVLSAVALLAAWLPARRAASLDPPVALRHE
jgi:predicted permease